MDITQRIRAVGQSMQGVVGPGLIEEAAREIERLRKIEAAAILLSDSLQIGFVACRNCGDQETTHDLDFAKELRIALGREPNLSPDPQPF